MAGEKIRILLIEDNPGDARLIGELLAAKGSTSFALEHADRLSTGLARLARGNIDVILLDLSLPDSQGLDGLNKICAQTPEVPVVVMSGLSDEAIAVNAVQEGAQDYLVKGKVDSDLLVRSLRYAMERQHLRVAWRESEGRYRLLADNAVDVIWTANMKWQITYVSPSIKRLLGYTVEEMKRLAIKDILTPDSLNQAVKLIRNQMDIITPESQYTSLSLTLEYVRKDSSRLWAEVTLSFLWDKDGRLSEILGVTRDITERKKAEEALRESEEELQAIFDSSGNGIALLNLEGRLIRVNKRVLEVGGYAMEEISDQPLDLLKMFTPGSIERMIAAKDIILSGKEVTAFECEVCTKSGEKISLEINAGPFFLKGQLFGLVAVMRDITERKRAEEALQESEERYRELFENANDVIYTHDLSGNFTSINKAGECLTGYTRDEVMGMNISRILTPESRELARQMITRKLNQEGSTRYELEIIAKDGHRISLEVSSRLIFEGDKPVSVQGIARDITERKRMEEELRRLSDAVRMSTDSITITDLEGNVMDTNEAGLELIGANNKGELNNLKMSDFITSEDRERALRDLGEVLKKGYVTGVEYHILTRDGREILVETSASVMKGPSGEPIGLVAVTRDVTERKRLEEALRESEERHRLYFDSVSDVVYSIAPDFTILSISPSVERVLGYKQEEMVGKKVWDLNILTPDCMELALSDITRVMSGERIISSEYEFIAKDGTKKVGDTSGAPIFSADGKVAALVSVARDITERKLMEKALRQSEHNYRMLFEGTIDGMLVTDAETIKVVLANQTAVRMCGLNSVEDAIGGNPMDLVHPDDREKVMGFFIQDVAGDGSKEVHEFRAVTKDGREIWLSGMGTRIEYGGKPAVLSSIRDITERKQAEQALRESEEKFRSVAETASDAIISLDSEGKIVFWNEAAETIFGYPAGDVMGKSLAVIMPERFRDIHEKAMKQVVSTGERKLAGKTLEVSALRKDGSEFSMEFTVAGWKSGEKIYSTAIARDITERREMERQLELSGRLAAVGELAAGVAHELNNPLAAIQGFAQFLTARKDLDEDIKKDLDTIYRESQRAAKITQNLLSFARQHEPEKHLISLNEVIEKTLELQAHPMEVNNIELVVELDPDLPKTLADFYQMQQVFVNIINNAEQAMMEVHRKGRLAVKTQKVGNTIRISFADNGPGIPEENLKMIFDPFFTTKEVGKGTGLGLSICYGLVEAHGGRIYARSKLGQGATFVVELPIVSENKFVAEAALLKPGSRGEKWKK